MTATESMSPARYRRGRIIAAARLLSGIAVPPNSANLEWQRLAEMPPWAFLKPADKDLFCLATGCLYNAGVLKRCIRGATIKHIRGMVGNTLYDAILANSELAKTASTNDLAQHSTRDDTLQNHLIAVGTALIVQATDSDMHSYIQHMFIDTSKAPLSLNDTDETAAIVVKKSWEIWSSNVVSNNA